MVVSEKTDGINGGETDPCLRFAVPPNRHVYIWFGAGGLNGGSGPWEGGGWTAPLNAPLLGGRDSILS